MSFELDSDCSTKVEATDALATGKNWMDFSQEKSCEMSLKRSDWLIAWYAKQLFLDFSTMLKRFLFFFDYWQGCNEQKVKLRAPFKWICREKRFFVAGNSSTRGYKSSMCTYKLPTWRLLLPCAHKQTLQTPNYVYVTLNASASTMIRFHFTKDGCQQARNEVRCEHEGTLYQKYFDLNRFVRSSVAVYPRNRKALFSI